MRAAHGWQQPDVGLGDRSSQAPCSWGSTNSIMLNLLLSLKLLCLVCKHRGGMFPLELKSTEMGLFLLFHFIHIDFMTMFEDTFDDT